MRAASIQVAKALNESRNPNTGYIDLQAFLRKPQLEITDEALRRLESKITTYHTQYKEERYKPMDVIYKDWNDVLKVRTARSVEQKLLEESYERKDGEHLEVTMQQKEGKQTVVATRKQFEQTVGFYEAESAHEMAFLIKNYGYQAVDKQDQRKYAKAKEMARV